MSDLLPEHLEMLYDFDRGLGDPDEVKQFTSRWLEQGGYPYPYADRVGQDVCNVANELKRHVDRRATQILKAHLFALTGEGEESLFEESPGFDDVYCDVKLYPTWARDGDMAGRLDWKSVERYFELVFPVADENLFSLSI